MSRKGQVIIIGGGVIGTACAHYLSRSGWAITLLDRGAFGQGCSHGNCGLVCPSHVLPLAGPGALGEAFSSLFLKDSPLAIRMRLDLSLWSWLVRFALRCRRSAMLEAGQAIQALLASSRALYQELMGEEPLDCEWQTAGLLFPYRRLDRFEKYTQTDRLLREVFDCPARRLEGDQVCELEPALKPGLAGGWYYEEDAHLRPDRLLSSWRALLEQRGVTIREHEEVKGFSHRAGLVRSVLTAKAEIPADAVVVATGAWTPLLAKQLGCRIPIQPGKGYSITMPRPARCPRIPLIFPETHVAVTPLPSGYRLGSTLEFAGYDDSLRPARLELLRGGAAPYLHQPWCDPVEEAWWGWRPMTYDGKPIIGRPPRLHNVIIAAGHNTLGLSMAPATGKLTAELLDYETPHIDPAPYAVTRF
jgi:D-amino-acid dehydrogenase